MQNLMLTWQPARKEKTVFETTLVKRTILFTIIFTLVLFTLMSWAMLSVAHAGQVTLAWDANDPAPAGYRIYQRTTDGYGSAPVWEGSATTCTINIPDDVEVAFVARAYASGQITGQAYESGNSNEVIAAPVVDTPKNLLLQALDRIAEGIELMRRAVLAE